MAWFKLHFSMHKSEQSMETFFSIILFLHSCDAHNSGMMMNNTENNTGMVCGYLHEWPYTLINFNPKRTNKNLKMTIKPWLFNVMWSTTNKCVQICSTFLTFNFVGT